MSNIKRGAKEAQDVNRIAYWRSLEKIQGGERWNWPARIRL